MFGQGLIFTWFVIVFFISGLFINLLQLCVLPLYWIHRRLYHALISKLCYCLYSEITLLGEWWSEIDLKVYGTERDIDLMSKENWLSVANHFSDIDWLVAWIFCGRVGILGDTMCFMKDFIKYVPTVGWAFWFSEWTFLQRDWNKDEKLMLRTMDTLKKHKHHYCMMLYCEGTRRTESKLLASQEYAKQNNIEPLKYHLLPRTKGFTLTVHELKDHAPALYDVEMAFTNPENATISKLVSGTKVEVHLNIRRVPMSSIPCSDSNETSNYCMQIYREKDKLMDYFVHNGCFPGPRVNVSRGYSNLITFSIFNILVGSLFIALSNYYIQFYGIYPVIACLLLLAVVAYALLGVLNYVTVTKKGSKFGLKDAKKKGQ